MTPPLLIFIVDDEAPARRELRHLLEQQADVRIVGEAGNGAAALKGIRETRPHLVFLDIHMPGLNGLELADLLCDLVKRPLFAFATAFDAYALQAFNVDAIDYLCKPLTQDRVSKTLAKAMRLLIAPVTPPPPRTAPESSRKLTLYRGETIVPTAPGRIVFFHAEEGEIVTCTVDGTFHTRRTLGDLEQRLEGAGFIRPHRSYLVNINHIREVIPWFNGSYKLVMNDAQRTKVQVSRYNAHQLKKHFDL